MQSTISLLLEQVAPWDDPITAITGAAVRPTSIFMMGTSLTLIVDQGSLVLGRWQGIFYVSLMAPGAQGAAGDPNGQWQEGGRE